MVTLPYGINVHSYLLRSQFHVVVSIYNLGPQVSDTPSGFCPPENDLSCDTGIRTIGNDIVPTNSLVNSLFLLLIASFSYSFSYSSTSSSFSLVFLFLFCCDSFLYFLRSCIVFWNHFFNEKRYLNHIVRKFFVLLHYECSKRAISLDLRRMEVLSSIPK